MNPGEDPNSQQMSGERGMGEMLDMQEAQQTQLTQEDEMLDMQEDRQSQSVQEIDIDEIVRWLEEIWVQEEEIRETYREAQWQEFIDRVKNPYPYLQ